MLVEELSGRLGGWWWWFCCKRSLDDQGANLEVGLTGELWSAHRLTYEVAIGRSIWVADPYQ